MFRNTTDVITRDRLQTNRLPLTTTTAVEQTSDKAPPSFRECPVEDIVVYNRSAWARKDAIEHLKRLTRVRIHEIGLTGQSKTNKSDSFIGLSLGYR